MVQNEDQVQTFGTWIRQQRKQHDLTQQELAKLLHCSQITLRKMEAGTYRPSKDMILRVVQIFNIPADEHATLFQLARGTPSTDPSTIPSAPSLPASPMPTVIARLPIPLTPLLGRAQELYTLHHYLHGQGVRLLTLTGPGGVGKTRLALQFGAELRTAFANQVYFIPLAPLRDPALVLPTIAQQLDLTEASEPALIQALALQPTLLLLDNFEHLMPAAQLLARLLAATTNLTLVVTSRARLQLYGEYDLQVPPLALPDLNQSPDLRELVQVPTVALFVARAQAAQANFALTDENAASIAEICTRLDGLPLAIELAAARVRLLPPAILLQYLSSRLALLIDGPRDVDERHQTLQQTIDWSYTLLTPAAQQLFTQLGVFAGSATLAAIQAVCAAPATPAMLVFEGLSMLLDNSLLQRTERAGGEAHFVMLETLREYALVQLGPAAAAVRERHATYYLDFAEAAEPFLKGAEQKRWVALLEDEHHNLRAALSWTLAHQPELALRLSGALRRFWYIHGHLTEGRQWHQIALDQAQSAPLAIRAKALFGLGFFAYAQGDYDAATTHYEASLTLRRDLGDTAGIAHLLNNLGLIAKLRGEYVQATKLYEDCLRLSQEVGDTWAFANALTNLGDLAQDQANFDQAASYFRESLALREQLGDTWGLCLMLFNLGDVAYYQRDYQQARDLLSQSLSLAEEIDDTAMRAYILDTLGQISLAQGDLATARRSLIESLRIRQDLGSIYTLVESLESFAKLRIDEGQIHDAPRLLGGAALLREKLGTPATPVAHRRITSITANVLTQLSQADFDAAWQAGAAVSLNDLLAEILGPRD